MDALKILFFLPLISAGLILLFPRVESALLKRAAICLGLIPFLVVLLKQTALLGAEIQAPWLPALNIYFHLKIDGMALLFVFLTTLIVPISLFTLDTENTKSTPLFYSLVFLLETFLIGFFCARDLALLTVFWEAMLLPIYFIIGMWGKEQSRKAAVQFLIYMLTGSVFLIAAVISLYIQTGTFNLDLLAQQAVVLKSSQWIFWVLLLAFAVKTPLFPFHAWLPNAYTRSSIAGTLLLSVILSKAGIFAIVRLVHPLFPESIQQWSPLLLSLAIAGVIYGGWAACTQKDFKRLIAYSSFSHVNFVLAGLFVWQSAAHTGALLQAFNHGITIAGLFLAAHWLEQRMNTTLITEKRGLAKFMPQLCWLTLLFILSSVALPGTSSFIGEILIFFGVFKTQPWLTPLLGLTVLLSVIYSLRFMQKVYFEAPSKHQPEWSDIKIKEWGLAVPLVILILWIGIYPAPFLKLAENKKAAETERVELLNKNVMIKADSTQNLNIRK